MLHPRQCSCFNCKNGYTPEVDKADNILRKWKKPTSKRPNRTKVINLIKDSYTKQEKIEYRDRMNFLKGL